MLGPTPTRPSTARSSTDPVVVGLGRILLWLGALIAAGLTLMLWWVLR